MQASDVGIAERLREEFRSAMRRVAATVTLITARDSAGNPHGMAATAFTSVSMDPPTALVCVNENASIVPVLLGTRGFCVNIIGPKHASLCRPFSRSDQRDLRFNDAAWSSDGDGPPFLRDSIASIACRIDDVSRHGSHIVIFACVDHVRPGSESTPLLYYHGSYRSLGPVLDG